MSRALLLRAGTEAGCASGAQAAGKPKSGWADVEDDWNAWGGDSPDAKPSTLAATAAVPAASPTASTLKQDASTAPAPADGTAAVEELGSEPTGQADDWGNDWGLDELAAPAVEAPTSDASRREHAEPAPADTDGQGAKPCGTELAIASGTPRPELQILIMAVQRLESCVSGTEASAQASDAASAHQDHDVAATLQQLAQALDALHAPVRSALTVQRGDIVDTSAGVRST